MPDSIPTIADVKKIDRLMPAARDAMRDMRDMMTEREMATIAAPLGMYRHGKVSRKEHQVLYECCIHYVRNAAGQTVLDQYLARRKPAANSLLGEYLRAQQQSIFGIVKLGDPVEGIGAFFDDEIRHDTGFLVAPEFGVPSPEPYVFAMRRFPLDGFWVSSGALAAMNDAAREYIKREQPDFSLPSTEFEIFRLCLGLEFPLVELPKDLAQPSRPRAKIAPVTDGKTADEGAGKKRKPKRH